MARETKQDRIVRGIIDSVTEHLHEYKIMEGSPGTKESDVEVWCQSFLKGCLGFTASAGYSIRSQESRGKLRPDLVVYKNEVPIFVVEVKKLGFDLDKSDFRSGKVQLAEYLGTIGAVRWGILTNGSEWKLFDFSIAGGIQMSYFDVKGDAEALEISKASVEELAYNVLDFHESSYGNGSWPELAKEATAFSPESMARAVLSLDVMKIIARTIRGEHEYKANIEVLTDRVYDLLSKGLDDSVVGWNETKGLEFKKYIRSQKRAIRRGRKGVSRKDTVTAEPQAAESPNQQAAVTVPLEAEKKDVA